MRCTWASNPLNIAYHDEEWGVPVHDERRWFEFLTLEGAQAGLSWDTILKKRERYREVFAGFRCRQGGALRLAGETATSFRSGNRAQPVED